MRFLILLLSLVVFPMSAQEFKIPAHSDWVVDEANLFPREDRSRILKAIQNLTNATNGGQMAVVTLKGLHGIPIEEAGIRIAEAWKVGRKGKDDGAILIIVPSERRMRLEIGYGWEGSINDAKAGDIIRELAKFFQEKRYTDGAVYAVGKVQFLLTGKAPENQPSVSDDNSLFDNIMLGLVIVIFFLIFGIRLFFGGGTSGHGGGFSGGGGGGGGGGFSGGGGGSFGGGGASGRW